MRSLMIVLPIAYRVLYVFYDFETTQNMKYSDRTTLEVRNLVYAKQFCSRCKNLLNIERDWE